MSELSFIGKNIPRVDALNKVTGKTIYAADFKESVLHAKILRSPHAHARIISMDASRAERFPGVQGIVTQDDVPPKRTGYILCLDRYVLPRDGLVRFVGEPVALVVADTPEIAEEALELIDVKYEVLPAVFDSEESIRGDCSVVIHPNKNDYSEEGCSMSGCVLNREIANVCASFRLRRGDIEQGFKDSDYIVENKYTFTGGSHARPELYTMDAWIDGDVLTVRTARTRMWGCHGWLCSLFSLPPNKIRMITPFTGGAFGGKGTIVTEALALLAAKKTGKKVRLTFTREEEFIDTNPRPSMIVYVKDGVTKDGILLARQTTTIVDIGAYGAAGGVLSGFTSHMGIMSVYNIPNWHCDAHTVYTNNPPTGTMRGVESPQVSWAVESNMDCIASILGMDPLELRRKNIVQDGDINALGQVLHDIYAKDCIEEAADLIDWKNKPKSEGKWKKGKGLAICSYSPAPWFPAEVVVKVMRDGNIELLVGNEDSGQGLITVLTQIAAEEFNVHPDKIRVIRGDTSCVPWDFGAIGSRSTWMTGNALILACREAKQKIFKQAASKLNVNSTDLKISNNRIYSKKSSKSFIELADLFQDKIALGEEEFIGKSKYVAPHTEIDPATANSPEAFPSYSYLSYGVEVAVNVETGEIKVVDVAATADIGQPINRKMCEAQIEGSISMGIGCMLYERFHRQEGRIVNPNFVSYKIPTAPEMPSSERVRIEFVGSPHPNGPFGAKALGEMGLIPFLAAINNAIYDAVGISMTDAPVTREQLFLALRSKDKTL